MQFLASGASLMTKKHEATCSLVTNSISEALQFSYWVMDMSCKWAVTLALIDIGTIPDVRFAVNLRRVADKTSVCALSCARPHVFEPSVCTSSYRLSSIKKMVVN